MGNITKKIKVSVTLAILIAFCISNFSCGGTNTNQNNLSLKNSSETPVPTSEESEMKEEVTIEGYPDERINAIEQESEVLNEIKDKAGDAHLYSVVLTQKAWSAGDVLTVAFNGGSPQIRQKIEETVKAWSNSGNIKFDFRNPSPPNTYREWTTEDNNYVGLIRIAFVTEGKNNGFWSALGRESIKMSCTENSVAKSCYFPNEASMNLGFTDQTPNEQQRLILHEFGHALGFFHEHQSPKATCVDEFLMDPDPGYIDTKTPNGTYINFNQTIRPGIKKYMSGYPDFWTDKQINYNFGKFPHLNEPFEVSNFDADSIMKYVLERWMYTNISVSTQSKCYSPEKFTLSEKDKIAARRRYPFDPQQITKVNKEKLNILNKTLKIKNLSEKVKTEIKESVKSIKNNQ